MRRALVAFSCCWLVAFALAGTAHTGGPPKKDDRAAAVDKLFAKWDKPDSPGAAVAIIQDGDTVYQRGYGRANLEHAIPITAGTLFLIASVSKQFTVFLILLLAQGGRINLDDEVRKHVPELPDLGEKVTVRHLIHHTSGLREELAVQALRGRGFEDTMKESDFFEWLKDQKELNFAPGSEYTYCNTGYSLLGLIVKRASGKSVREYAEENVFKPLGMKSTRFRDDYRTPVKGSATSYGPRPGGSYGLIPVPYSMAGATNVYTTVEDLARWDRNFYDAKVGGKEVIAGMLRKGKLRDGREIAYAGGLNHEEYRGLKTVRHDGSHGGFRSTLLRFPEQRFSVIILANAADVKPAVLAKKIADVYLADRLKSSPAEVKVSGELLDAYAGDYKLGPGLYAAFTREGDRLTLRAQGLKLDMTPLSEVEFEAAEGGLRCRFEKGEGGKVEKVTGRAGPQELAGRRVRRAELTEKQLKGYEGDFYSRELRVVYTVSARDGKLVVRLPRGEAALEAWEGEEFTAGAGAPFGTLQFTRGEGGRVTGFRVSNPRLRNLRFDRVALPSAP
jgi:CubicO group peptidase (beta-lactamase class C family)